MKTARMMLLLSLGVSHFTVAQESPELAVRALEDAYTARDVEAAVVARDFVEEARRMLVRIDPKLAAEADILKQTAEVLELGYRNELTKTIFPRFKGARCTITEVVPVEESLVRVMEDCTLRQGATSKEKLFVTKSTSGWRVIAIPDEP